MKVDTKVQHKTYYPHQKILLCTFEAGETVDVQ